VDGDIVLEVCRDFDLSKATADAAIATVPAVPAAPAAPSVAAVAAVPLQKPSHLALVTPEAAEPESTAIATGPVMAVDNTSGRQHHEAADERREERHEVIERRTGSLLGLR
jgi:hypothetical protein